MGFVFAPIFMTGVATVWHESIFVLLGIIGLVAAIAFISIGFTWPTKNVDNNKSAEPSKTLLQWLQAGIRLLLTLPIMMCFLYFVLHQMGGRSQNFSCSGTW